MSVIVHETNHSHKPSSDRINRRAAAAAAAEPAKQTRAHMALIVM